MMPGLIQRTRRDAKRAFSRFANIGPASLAQTLARALALHLRQPPRKAPARPERLVVTLTTTPARVLRLRPTLHSLLDQTEPPDRILLALPYETRAGLPYPDLSRLRLPEGVEALRCVDEGPATKILPALRREPSALLVVADDDVIYPRGFIATLLSEHRRRPGAAIGYRGLKLQKGVPFALHDHVFATGIAEAMQVDVLFGTWGYLVPAGSLGEEVFDLASAPEEVRWVDDIWISGQLARAGVARWVASADELPIETFNVLRSALTSGINASGRNDEIGLRYFESDW